MRKLKYQWIAQSPLQGGINWINNLSALVGWQNNFAALVQWLATTNAAYINVPVAPVNVSPQPPTVTNAGGVLDYYPSGTRPDGTTVGGITVITG